MRKLVIGGWCLAIGLVLLTGCRREDVRVFEEPGVAMSEAQVRKALGAFAGVKLNTLKVEGGKVHVEYDSMQLAKENMRRVLGK